MDFHPINKVIISCSACNAGIKLDIASKDNVAMEELIAKSKDFVCPVCKAKLDNVDGQLKCVSTYNATIKVLTNYSGLFTEFE